MNKRFVLKFAKYMSLYFLITTTLAIIGFIVFVYLSSKPSHISQLDNIELELYPPYSPQRVEVPKPILELAKQNEADVYVTKLNGEIVYPHDIHANIKSRLIKNAYQSHSIKYKYGTEHYYFVFIYRQGENPNIVNGKEIDVHKLLESMRSNGLNPYEFNINNGHLTFYANSGVDQTDSGLMQKQVQAIFLSWVAIFIANIVSILIISWLIARRLSQPLFYYSRWIQNLSKGKLHQPDARIKNRERTRQTYEELDDAIFTLNKQLVKDRFYHDQIQYYKTKWISQISHDLKSPLTSIYGFSKLVRGATETDQQHLKLISEKADYIREVIDNLSAQFKFETEQMAHHRESFEIQSTVERVISTLGFEKITTVFNFSKEMTFYGNKLYFERMLFNLINNSLDHNAINPNIHLAFKLDDTHLKIDYKDDGKGLPSYKLDELIQKSYTSKKDKSEHGIGLSIIKDAVKFHQGELTLVPSQKGAHFKIHLPTQTQ
ncbi:sensor histidine kinase [Staphylococcus ratti]|uniref:histidine kinase n=1 Tax=Staphylococcus ratti TaxID=2892440 RepID=A0ABY3PD87_9STAP|nr:HAMP domain-containing sensor histidine kinase [Staphylococcus ratti]UEX90302.1 HAMP domain-containing histidine kinase [Staphylococcus ratti]